MLFFVHFCNCPGPQISEDAFQRSYVRARMQSPSQREGVNGRLCLMLSLALPPSLSPRLAKKGRRGGGSGGGGEGSVGSGVGWLLCPIQYTHLLCKGLMPLEGQRVKQDMRQRLENDRSCFTVTAGSS